MGHIFNLDNRFFQGMNKVIDCVMLNALWLFCCVPMFSMFFMAWENAALLFWLLCWVSSALAGPATVAFYYAMNKVVRHGRSYVWREYWSAFRSNFKQAAAAALIIVGLALFMGMDSYIMYQYAKTGAKGGALYVLFLVLIGLAVMWGIYVFTYMARFANGLKQLLKNAALIAIANLPRTILLFLLLAGAVFLILLLPPLMMFVPAIYMLAANFILEKVFRKYMSEEDLAAEEERNREFYN